MSPKPNFFIVGAPKSGTTALYQYLGSHPNVFMPRIKEPHFLADDFPSYRTIHREDQYLRLFAEATPTQTAIGEASVFYLFSSEAVPNILRLNPEARLIVMLRNPVDMAHALHSQFLYTFREDEKDFERAWRLQAARRRGESHPRHCMEPAHLQYRDVAALGAQVERLLQVIPREQVLLLFQEDMQSAPRGVYQATLDFLDLADDGRSGFPTVNQNKTHRVEWISRSLMRPPFPINFIKGAIKRVLQLHNTRLGKWIYASNQSEHHRPSMPVELRAELAAEFRPDIQLLEAITGRDLRHWYEA